MKIRCKNQTNISTVLVLLSVLIVSGITSQAQPASWASMNDIRQLTEFASAGNWEIVKHDKGVILSSRWLTFGDSLKTREISAHFVAEADIQSILDNLMLPAKILAWNDGVKSIKILRHEGATWITHTLYDIPYPLSQQDLVVKNELIQGKSTIILISALPDHIPCLKNVCRQQLYFGKWELKPNDERTTEITFSALSFSKSSIPRFMRDPIVQDKLFNSFLSLKELSASEAKAVVVQSPTQSTTSQIVR